MLRPIATLPFTQVRSRWWRACAWLCTAALLLPAGRAQALPPHQPAAPQAVLIYLKDQPFAAEVQRRQADFQAQAEALQAGAAASAAPLPAGAAPRTTAQEAAAAQAGLDLTGSAEAQRQQALAALEALRGQQQRALFQAAQPAVAASQAPLEALIAAQGGTVTARLTVVNALAARVPPGALAALAQHPAVASVVPEEPARAALETGPASLGAPALWHAGYTGGALDLAVVDTGLDASHPAFAGQNFLEGRFLSMADAIASGANDPSPDDLHGHGTHIAGIAGSTWPGKLGVAYGLDKLLNAKAGWKDGGAALMYPSDSMAAVEWALFQAADPAEVVNLSFSACALGADDTAWARFFDAVVGASGATVVVAAGNTSSGCGTVTSPSLAHNVLSIANINDFGTANRADDVISATSLPGPTAGGRRKPDLAAPGTAINSANAAWEDTEETQPDFVSMSGTSMAAPHAAGAALLLMQAGVTDPRALRALLINTAEDKGLPGWDAAYGWGYIDLPHALAHRADTRLGTLTPGMPYRLYKGPALEGDTITLAWHRHVPLPCNSSGCSEPVPVSNLDLALYSAATNAVLDVSGAAALNDTVEQVQAPADSALNVVRVSVLTLDAALSQETFALATEEGFTPAVGPVLAHASPSLPVPPGLAAPVNLRLANTGDLPAHQVTLTVTVPAGLNLPPGPQVFNVGVLGAGASYTVPLTVTLPPGTTQAISLAATGTGYGTSVALAATAEVQPADSVQWLPWAARP